MIRAPHTGGDNLILLKIAPGKSMPVHSHQGAELTQILKGAYDDELGHFAPGDIADGSDIRLVAAPTYDLDAAVAHLSAAAQIRTISHQDPAENQIAEWDKLHAWLAATYPATHGAMTRTILPNRTLVYHWPGSDPTLAPIIVMARLVSTSGHASAAAGEQVRSLGAQFVEPAAKAEGTSAASAMARAMDFKGHLHFVSRYPYA